MYRIVPAKGYNLYMYIRTVERTELTTGVSYVLMGRLRGRLPTNKPPNLVDLGVH